MKANLAERDAPVRFPRTAGGERREADETSETSESDLDMRP